MKSTWQLQDAKAQFSQLVEDALNSGPQWVTRRGRNAVVVLAAETYEKLITRKPSFRAFLLDAPAIPASAAIHEASRENPNHDAVPETLESINDRSPADDPIDENKSS
ncbi:type II toxin-antitoxin system Phd/YefM family antitoxin [bacterium]|nr:type II toxin-antitoxin system Phd/YefM family antitoxin [candidate division CSSED10-310 bacterium]